MEEEKQFRLRTTWRGKLVVQIRERLRPAESPGMYHYWWRDATVADLRGLPDILHKGYRQG